MSAPFTGPSPFPDPAANPAMQGQPGPGDPAAQPSEQPPQAGDQTDQPGDHPYVSPIDLEGCISEAIETACHLAIASSTLGTPMAAEEFMRFAQGVNFLATALAAIQPQHSAADAQYATAVLSTAQKHAQAQMQADTQRQAAEAQARAAASRPTPSQPSARG